MAKKVITKKDGNAVELNEQQKELLSLATVDPERSGASNGNVIDFNSVSEEEIHKDLIFNIPGFDPLMNPETQMRTSIDENYIEELQDALEANKDLRFPPIDLIITPEGKIFIVDGFHRLHAYTRARRNNIPVRIAKGTKEDAIKSAAGANSTHGKRRTNADKKKAAKTLFALDGMANKSDNYLARILNVSQPFIGKVREELGATSEKRVGEDGIERSVKAKEKHPQRSEEREIVSKDFNGDELPKELKDVFTTAVEIERKLSEIKSGLKGITSIISVDTDLTKCPNHYAIISEGWEETAKKIRSLLNTFSKSSLPRYIGEDEKGKPDWLSQHEYKALTNPSEEEKEEPGTVDSDGEQYDSDLFTSEESKPEDDDVLNVFM